MFRGLSTLSLDAKGRMAMPARFREIIEESCQGRLVVTIWQDGQALVIYPLPEFDAIQRKVDQLSDLNPMTKRLKRLVIGHATDVELDSSGRILIPPTLRSYVELEKKAVLVGQSNKLELWGEDRWNRSREEMLGMTVDPEVLPPELQNFSL